MHIAIVMDGNGRWAEAQGQPRLYGHREGANAVRRAVEAARREGIEVLTLFAFSGDNWGRPPAEVDALMLLFGDYLRAETRRCTANGIRLSIIGRRDRLPASLVSAVEQAEQATAGGSRMLLRIAIDYSARDAIVRAARAWRQFEEGTGRLDYSASFSLLMQAAIHSAAPAPDVDLLIRTGGEQRLSDFLLWECAYAELVFTNRMWPEFRATDLQDALREFHSRDRRFGRLPASPTLPEHPAGAFLN
jgi:undecaprenyl diphosphate synthase